MIRKISTYIIFSSILVVIYFIFCMLYSRDIKMTEALIWYSVLYTLIVIINLIKNRKYRWITLILICSLLVILTMISPNPLEGNLLDIFFVEPHEINIPFLPFFEIPAKSIENRRIIIYLIYFLSPLIYWYFVYYISKRIYLCIYKCCDKLFTRK